MCSLLAVAGLALYALCLSLSAAAPAQSSTGVCSFVEAIFMLRRVSAQLPLPQCGDDYCKGTLFNSTKYYCGDIRLGPVVLPQNMPLSNIVAEYDRFGGLSPGEFIQKWWNPSEGDWFYPTEFGFQLNTYGKPISGQQELPVGLLVDRFGGESGEFLAAAYTPYSQRSLPPQNFDTPETSPTYPCNYHVYKVIKPFVVTSGTIAAWFGQPGQGTQYQASSNISTLVDNGCLERVNLHESAAPGSSRGKSRSSAAADARSSWTFDNWLKRLMAVFNISSVMVGADSRHDDDIMGVHLSWPMYT